MRKQYYIIVNKEDINTYDDVWLELARYLKTNPDNIAYYHEFKTTYHVYLLTEIDYYLTYINKGSFKDFR